MYFANVQIMEKRKENFNSVAFYNISSIYEAFINISSDEQNQGFTGVALDLNQARLYINRWRATNRPRNYSNLSVSHRDTPRFGGNNPLRN